MGSKEDDTGRIIQDDTDLTELVGFSGQFKRLVENCFTDEDNGNVTWGDLKASTLSDFLQSYGTTQNRMTKLKGWVEHYGLENCFKQEEEQSQPASGKLVCLFLVEFICHSVF